jgi:hypothetical protein
LAAADEQIVWQEETAIEVGTVCGEGVDLAFAIDRP